MVLISKKELLFQLVLHVVVLLFFAYDRRTPGITVEEFCYFLTYAIGAAIVTYYLMPKYLYTEKYLPFAISFCGIIVTLIILEELLFENIFHPNTERALTFGGLLPTILHSLPILTILSGGKFAWDSLQKQHKIDALESSIRDSELQFLKSQINPHFLFNNLNNLYSYALESSPKTPEIIIEMSGILRYMLYECKERYVPLEQEIQQLDNFIRLYKLQIEDRGNVKFNLSDIDPTYSIAPLILIVFIENAFKHSQSGQSHGIEIDISLAMQDNKLSFCCSNNFKHSHFVSKQDARGIGLANVKKRLSLLYPNKHLLNIFENDNFYTVELELELTKTMDL